MIEFLKSSVLDVKTKYFFIVLAYHSSRLSEGTDHTLETIIKRIGSSKSAARKAIKELHNSRILYLDYSLSAKITSLCELERFKSSFLDLPDFLINYIDSYSIRKKTIDTNENNNSSVVNKNKLSYKEFVCAFYIWITKNKETGVCLIPYKEMGYVINGNAQTVRRVLNKINDFDIPDFDKFIVMFIKGAKTRKYEMLSFCIVNPTLISKGCVIDRTSSYDRSFFHKIPMKFKIPHKVIDFIELECGNGKKINGFLSVVITKILNLIFNERSVDNLYNDIDIISFEEIICDIQLRFILDSIKNDEIKNVIYIISLLSVRYILKYKLNKIIERTSPDKNYKFQFLCDENMHWEFFIIDVGEDESFSFKVDKENKEHIKRIKNLIGDLLKLITVE